MNAIQFIQQHNLENARQVVNGVPETSTHFMYDSELMMADYLKHRPDVSEFSFDLWCGKHWGWKPFLRSKRRIDLLELKRLVDSVNLVNSNGGWNGTKNTIALFQSSLELGLYHGVAGVDAEKEIPRLKQAIADYEALYPFGGDQ